MPVTTRGTSSIAKNTTKGKRAVDIESDEETSGNSMGRAEAARPVKKPRLDNMLPSAERTAQRVVISVPATNSTKWPTEPTAPRGTRSSTRLNPPSPTRSHAYSLSSRDLEDSVTPKKRKRASNPIQNNCLVDGSSRRNTLAVLPTPNTLVASASVATASSSHTRHAVAIGTHAHAQARQSCHSTLHNVTPSAVKPSPTVVPETATATTLPVQQAEPPKTAIQDANFACLPNLHDQLDKRPYLTYLERELIFKGAPRVSVLAECAKPSDFPLVLHYDFTTAEVRALRRCARRYHHLQGESANDPTVGLRRLLVLKKPPDQTESIFKNIIRQVANNPDILPSRTTAAVQNYLLDLKARRTKPDGIVLTAECQPLIPTKSRPSEVASRVSGLLLQRELYGPVGAHDRGYYPSMERKLLEAVEADLQLRAQWSNCAGDINTAVWLSDETFIVGTTTHCDRYNQHFNKPGNLAFGSVPLHGVYAYPHHNKPRPKVAKSVAPRPLTSALERDLYTTVCDSEYDSATNRAFTCGYDRTVKIWRPHKMGLQLLGSWPHAGNVNFVTVSKDGFVATGADVAQNAVRVYQIDEDNISESQYVAYSSARAAAEVRKKRNWSYCPVTMKWGLAPGLTHLLLVGFASMSLTEDPYAVPQGKEGCGELAVFNAHTGAKMRIANGIHTNVFDAVWHPHRNCFFVGTSSGCRAMVSNPYARTTIHIFQSASADRRSAFTTDGYVAVKTLDCPAVDINEIIVRPNSLVDSYVCAGCTDGNVYVWDTANCDADGDKPLHVLPHGPPIETVDEERREEEDVGVRFLAFGKTMSRLYSGSSDGVVRVWDIRADSKPAVRNLLEVPGSITFGVFSPDHSRLLIGDNSARISLLSIYEDDESKVQYQTIGGRQVKKPQFITPHAALADKASGSGIAQARYWLKSKALKICPIGVVKGPAYANIIGLYNADDHWDHDVGKPLHAAVQSVQQENHQRDDKKKLGLLVQHDVTKNQTLRREKTGRSAATKLVAKHKELATLVQKLDVTPKLRENIRAEDEILDEASTDDEFPTAFAL